MTNAEWVTDIQVRPLQSTDAWQWWPWFPSYSPSNSCFNGKCFQSKTFSLLLSQFTFLWAPQETSCLNLSKKFPYYGKKENSSKQEKIACSKKGSKSHLETQRLEACPHATSRARSTSWSSTEQAVHRGGKHLPPPPQKQDALQVCISW